MEAGTAEIEMALASSLSSTSSDQRIRQPVIEADLYPPIKGFFERLGYTVKGEIGACDVVAIKPGFPPIVVELKLRFNLELVLQAVERMALTDVVYFGVAGDGGRARSVSGDRRITKLRRMLGIGLLAVYPASGRVEVLLDPGPYRPRKAKSRVRLLLDEHARRIGDPHRGGEARGPRMTAYRQEALRCAALIGANGTMTLAALRAAGTVPNAPGILQRDVYGWFERVGRGRYRLSTAGQSALRHSSFVAENSVANGNF
jgi:hypothetical protein